MKFFIKKNGVVAMNHTRDTDIKYIIDAVFTAAPPTSQPEYLNKVFKNIWRARRESCTSLVLNNNEPKKG